MRPVGEERGASSPGNFTRRATQPSGMQRRTTVDDLLTQDTSVLTQDAGAKRFALRHATAPPFPFPKANPRLGAILVRASSTASLEDYRRLHPKPWA